LKAAVQPETTFVIGLREHSTMPDRVVPSSDRLNRGSGTGSATGLLRATPIAAVLAAIANAIVYAVARAADTLPSDVLVDTPGGKQSIGLLAVISATVLPIILGGILLALLARFTRAQRRIFVITATIVTILSLISPLTIADAPGEMKATLVAMHIVAAVVGVGALLRLARV